MVSNVRYNALARTLHAVIALLIIFNLITGLLHDPLSKVIQLMPVHKSVGLTILVLSIVRVLWRFTWKRPPHAASMSGFEKAASEAMHGLFYVLMIAMPLSGWIFTSVGKYPNTWFGLFPWPGLGLSKSDAIVGLSHEFHEIVGYAMIALVLGHIAAALRHQFLLKDNLLRRIW